MNFDQYQVQAEKTAIYDDPLYPILGLTEEAGEVAGKVAKSLRDKTPLDEDVMMKEMGDVLWMLSAIATDYGFSLAEIAQRNLDKLADRAKRGVLGGSGDNR